LCETISFSYIIRDNNPYLSKGYKLLLIIYIAILVNVVFCPRVAILIAYNLGFTLVKVVLYNIQLTSLV
jgi:hypothetical protein